jgi:aromatic-L-amino-acid decarboxylase
MNDKANLGEVGDLGPEEFRRVAHEATDWIADYLTHVGELPVQARVRPGQIRSQFPNEPPEEGEPLESALETWRSTIVPGVTHWNHPAFFGYFPSSASAPGILGEMLAAALNVNAMVWRSSPAATELEEVATDWLRQLLGLPADFDGVINDTASSSTLYALATARQAAYPDVRETGLFGQAPGRIYASDQAHSSVEKAVLALGLGRTSFRAVESDDAFRMRPEALAAALEEDRAAGVRAIAVVATLGTTSTASVDPIREIVPLAKRYGAWLHVDAAYAGPAAVVPELRPIFSGWEDADSVVVNPHKWFFTPTDCSVLFCRHPELLVRAFSIVPEYLRSAEQSSTRSLMDYGIALGRRFRAVKLWLVIRTFGRAGLARRLGAYVRMASEMATWIDEVPGWERIAPASFSTVVFRYAPDGLGDAEANDLNQTILDRVNASGEAFLTHTVLRGRMAIRMAIGNVRTTPEHVARTWALLREVANDVGGQTD